MAEKKVGQILHYYSEIGVGVIKVLKPIKKGDKIHVKGHTTDFTQKLTSMQIEHKKIESAKKGQEIGVKLKDKVREHDVIYLAE